VWSAYYGYAIDKVESVQRRFTKRLHGFHDMEYSIRLNKLNLQSLEYRRLAADLILTYQIIFAFFGLADIDPNDYFCLKGSDSTRLRGNPYKITVNQCMGGSRNSALGGQDRVRALNVPIETFLASV